MSKNVKSICYCLHKKVLDTLPYLVNSWGHFRQNKKFSKIIFKCTVVDLPSTFLTDSTVIAKRMFT